MNLLLWAISLGTIGKLILGFAVLRVHMYIAREHSIDSVVLRAIKREKYLTLFALALMVISYVLEILFYQGATEFLTCIGSECASAVSAAFQN